MQMTNSEICASYRDAKNKKEQVRILSELNDCKTGTILEILQRGGFTPLQLPRKRTVTSPAAETPKPAEAPKPAETPKPAEKVIRISLTHAEAIALRGALAWKIGDLEDEIWTMQTLSSKLGALMEVDA